MVRGRLDVLLLVLILAIGAISLLVIFSINQRLALNQLLFWVIGLIMLLVISAFDYRDLTKLSIIFYIGALISLILVFFTGDPVRGSVRWIDLGVFRFQPSEIAKIASILVLSSFFLERSASSLKNLMVSMAIFFPAAILILIQPDIGNVLAFLAIWAGICLVSGLRPKHVIAVAVGTIVISLLFFRLLAPYQKERIRTFISPSRDPLGTGYQIIQSKIAVGSGQLFGRGLGRSSQSQLKFLPEAESDFIFASTSEQLGLVGAGLLILLYSLLNLRILSFAKSADRVGKLIITGAISYFLIQFFVNVGMNMGLFPVTGITLPLASYGGSSLISTLFLVGIVLSIRRLT